MATLNRAMLIGRITADPEPVRTLANGNKVVSFRLAVGRSRKNPQGGYDPDPNALFIDCDCFAYPDSKRDLTAVISQYCSKGAEIYVEGSLRTDEWTDKQSGQQRSKIKLLVHEIQLIGGKTGSAPRAADAPASPTYADLPADSGEDIPF